MTAELTELQALDCWRRAIVERVRREGPDLSARQVALLLSVYLTPPPHTVRGLASLLKVSKPAITRAVDRLSALEMVRRKVDENDRRSVLIQRTVRGSVFLHEFGELIVAAFRQLGGGGPGGFWGDAPRPPSPRESPLGGGGGVPRESPLGGGGGVPRESPQAAGKGAALPPRY